MGDGFSRGARWRWLAGLLAVMLLAAPLTVVAQAGAATAGQRLDLRVLLVSDGTLTVEALAAAMEAEGVPFTRVNMGDADRPHLDDAGFLSDTASDGSP